MPTRPKPAKVLALEGKSHRTKAELDAREKAEKALLSGKKMRESKTVAANRTAHLVFLRIEKIMGAIEKNDALYESVINRYCLLAAEVTDYEETRGRLRLRGEQLIEDREAGAFDADEYHVRLEKLLDQEITCDNMLQRKRKMMLDIEKENVMTIASALRAIPKTPEEDDADDPMSRMLAARLARANRA